MRIIPIVLLGILIVSCKPKSTPETSETHAYTNALIKETSPYLLQHAHNPVNWNGWNDSTLARAKKENKLMLISVGYAACHWCHVMERESFQDTIVAQTMNNNFINVKVDREERPDVDQIYMNAVQLLTGSGGWPMNVIALPDGRPVWGGTYFPKDDWLQILNQLLAVYQNEPQKLYEQAAKLEKGIKSLDVIEVNTTKAAFSGSEIADGLKKWETTFDYDFGGYTTAQKFMRPNNFQFLLRYAFQNSDTKLLSYVKTTLDQMAYGGVYDQIGGGFSRYATDVRWHIPHFEKMLYDNAQLVSLYAEAYKLTKNNLYKNVVYETLSFVERELYHKDGYFFSSLDADSDNAMGHHEEGAYYVWTKTELQQLLKEDVDLFSDFFNVNSYGKWEKENYVLIRKDPIEEIAAKHHLSVETVNKKIGRCKAILLEAREQRARPNLDDKSLTSWNALMLKGYLDAYGAFGEERFLTIAKRNATFIVENQLNSDSRLNHSFKNGKSTINGYLEDYSSSIAAFLALYEHTTDSKWLDLAKRLTDYSITNFYDERSKMFFFTANQDTKLVSRSIEYRDNVIPASNSIMAKNLFELSHHFEDKSYLRYSKQMLNNVKVELQQYPSGFSNWMDLMLNFTKPFYEVAVVGPQAREQIQALNQLYIPNKLIAGSNSPSDLPLLKHRYVGENTLFYICQNAVCKLPTADLNKAKTLIKK